MASFSEPLTSVHINTFLSIKGIKATCSECGAHNAGYEDETTGDYRFTDLKFPFPNWSVNEAGASDKVLLVCQDCGYTRNFNRQIVLRVLGLEK